MKFLLGSRWISWVNVCSSLFVRSGVLVSGPETISTNTSPRAALRRFQAREGLVADRFPDPGTLRRLGIESTLSRSATQ